MRNLALITVSLAGISAGSHAAYAVSLDDGGTADTVYVPVTAPAPMDTRPASFNSASSPPMYVPAGQQQQQAATPAAAPKEFVPAVAPNYAEAGINYYNVTGNYGNQFGQFVNVQYQTDPWNRWSAGVQHATAFKEDGEAIGIGNTHTFNEDWYSDVGASMGSGASFLTQYRLDAALNRKWLENRNFITTLGVTWDRANSIYTDRTLHLAAAYYFPAPWVVQAGFNLNDSEPGSVISPSGFGAVTYGFQGNYFVTGRYMLAREGYQLVGPTSINNSFTSQTYGVNVRKWVGKDWGVNVGSEFYTNPYYNRTGGTFSVFKEF